MDDLREVLKGVNTELPNSVLTSLSNAFQPLVPYFDAAEKATTEFIVANGGKSHLVEWQAFLKREVNRHSTDLPLMNPFRVVAIAAAYVLAVVLLLVLLRATGINLKNFFLMKIGQKLHNLFLILLSSYMCFEILRQAILHKYSIWGNGVQNTQAGWPMAKIIWLFYISKVYEFGDTFIMLFRHNFDQVSFLHVYHHFTIFVIWWYVTFLAPGGDSYFSAALNSFVHVIMYTYYFSTSVGIRVPNVLKYSITYFQMTQFLLNFSQAAYDLVFPVKGYPRTLCWVLLIYMVTLLMLFYNFLRTSSKRKKSASKDQSSPTNKRSTNKSPASKKGE